MIWQSCAADWMFQFTAARRRLQFLLCFAEYRHWFQFTAARRRLHRLLVVFGAVADVSIHSRPKAAAHPPGHPK